MMMGPSSTDATPQEHWLLLRSESAARHDRGLGHPLPCVRRPTNSFIENSIEAGILLGLGTTEAWASPCRVRTLLASPWPVLAQATLGQSVPVLGQAPCSAGTGLEHQSMPAGRHGPACRQAWAGVPAGMGRRAGRHGPACRQAWAGVPIASRYSDAQGWAGDGARRPMPAQGWASPSRADAGPGPRATAGTRFVFPLTRGRSIDSDRHVPLPSQDRLGSSASDPRLSNLVTHSVYCLDPRPAQYSCCNCPSVDSDSSIARMKAFPHRASLLRRNRAAELL
jgi:hypothetical protein